MPRYPPGAMRHTRGMTQEHGWALVGRVTRLTRVTNHGMSTLSRRSRLESLNS